MKRARLTLTTPMGLVRHHLSWLVAGLLAVQFAALAATPLALCCQDAAVPQPSKAKCCVGAEPGQTCPMHRSREESATCRMSAICSTADAALLSLAGGLGLLPPLPVTSYMVEPTGSVSALELLPIARADIPESPPPRE